MNDGESLILCFTGPAKTPQKTPRGRPKTTYLQVVKTQLKEKHFQTLEDAMMEAKDREVASSRPGPKLFSRYWSTVVVIVDRDVYRFLTKFL